MMVRTIFPRTLSLGRRIGARTYSLSARSAKGSREGAVLGKGCSEQAERTNQAQGRKCDRVAAERQQREPARKRCRGHENPNHERAGARPPLRCERVVEHVRDWRSDGVA